MANSTLLTLVTQFAMLKNLQPPSSVVTSSDSTIQQVWACLNNVLDDLADMNHWEWMKVAADFTPVSAGSGLLMEIARTDFTPRLKYMIKDSLWSKAQRLPVAGPLSDAQWQSTIQLQVAPAQFSFRWFANKLQIFPYVAPPTLPDYQFSIEYETDQVCSYFDVGSSTTIYSTTYDADNSVSLFPDRLVSAGLVWRWKYEKGFAYAEDKQSFYSLCTRAYGNDGNSGSVRLSTDSTYPQVVRPGLLIPAGNWNQ